MKKKTKKNGSKKKTVAENSTEVLNEEENQQANDLSVKSLGRYSSTGDMELFSTHKNRLVIQQDATMLANRISMLQAEEAKILKKINLTRKRADEIMKVKQRNDEIFNTRMKEKEEKMRIEEESRQKYINDKLSRQLAKTQTIKAIKQSKREEFKMGKRMTLQHDIYKQQYLEEVRKENQKKKERVKMEEEIRSEKLKLLEESKKNKNSDYYKNRVDKERLRILEHEKKIKHMEKLEAELLNRLKNSQQLEQNEYNNLEKALKECNQACEERRINQVMIRKPRPKEIVQAKSAASTHESKSVSALQ